MTDTNGNTILPDGFTLFHLGAAPTVYSDAVTGPPRFVVSPAEIRDGRGVKWKAGSVKFVSLSKIGMYIPLEHTPNMSIPSGNMHIN